MSGAHPGPMLAALALLTVVRAQIVEPGMCPFSSTPANWNEEEFVAGPWYEIKALTLSGLHDANPRPGCTRWHLSPSGDGRGLHARLAYRTREGDAVVRAFAQYTMSELHPRFNMTFHDLGVSGVSRSVDMKLVAADYGDFALLLGCSEPNLFERKVVSWMLSRSPFLSEAAQEALHTLYSRHGIHAEKFVDTAHDEATCSGATDVAWTAATGTTRTSGAVDMTALPESRVHDTSASLPSSRDEIFKGNAVGEVSTASALPNYILEDTFNSRGVSWSYLGSPWLVRGQLWAVLLALAVLALLACVVACKAAGGRLQRSGSKPVLPLHRQDVVVATLGGSVDYSRFGGFGQGLTRKHVSEPNAGSPNA